MRKSIQENFRLPDKVTIKTIASDLGISHMTVSRVMNDHPSVSDILRERVLTHASKVGYTSSRAALALRGSKSGTIGLLLPNIVNEFYAHFADALTTLCDSSKQNLVIHLTDDDPEKEFDAILRLNELHADAVIMVPSLDSSNEDHQNIPFNNLSVVQFIRTRSEKVKTSSITVDDSDAITEAVDHLVTKDHRDIAFIGTSTKMSSGHSRLNAFLSAIKSHKIDLNPGLVKTLSPSYSHGADSVDHLISGDIKASAIICGGVEITRGALDRLLQSNLALPEDMAFIGYGDPSLYQWIKGGISTISLPIKSLAEDTFSMLQQTDNETHIEQVARLIVRQTT